MAKINVPTYLLPSYIERLRWETRQQKALLDLAERRLDPMINWDGLLEHYKVFFHEDLPSDLVFRRYFDELKTLSEDESLKGKKFIEVSSDLARAVKEIAQ